LSDWNEEKVGGRRIGRVSGGQLVREDLGRGEPYKSVSRVCRRLGLEWVASEVCGGRESHGQTV
jgi:hypothetical protein